MTPQPQDIEERHGINGSTEQPTTADNRSRHLQDTVDQYLEKTYWVVDFLPRQVPANSPGQYFKIQDFYLKQPRFGTICQKLSNILIKLNCYYDFTVCHQDRWEDNPSPSSLAEWMSTGDAVLAIIKDADAMIVFCGDDLYMTVYHPDEQLLALVTTLANAEGFYVWKPTNQD